MMFPHPEDVLQLHTEHGHDLANQFRTRGPRPSAAGEPDHRFSALRETFIIRLRLRLRRRARTL